MSDQEASPLMRRVLALLAVITFGVYAFSLMVLGTAPIPRTKNNFARFVQPDPEVSNPVEIPIFLTGLLVSVIAVVLWSFIDNPSPETRRIIRWMGYGGVGVIVIGRSITAITGGQG